MSSLFFVENVDLGCYLLPGSLYLVLIPLFLHIFLLFTRVTVWCFEGCIRPPTPPQKKKKKKEHSKLLLLKVYVNVLVYRSLTLCCYFFLFSNEISMDTFLSKRKERQGKGRWTVNRGASVYFLCRSKERGEDALSKIQTTTGNQNVYLEVCDLSSVSEIKSSSAKLSSKGAPLDVLLRAEFCCKCLGTYALTESMLLLLEKDAPDARVITVSSGGMYTAPLTKDLQRNL